MRVHLLSVPNTQTLAGYELDGFCLRTMLFADLLKRLGHEVWLYGVEANTAPCDQFIPLLTNAERLAFIGQTPYQNVPFEGTTPLFNTFNVKAAQYIHAHKQPQDVIATIAGSAQLYVSQYNPELRFLEYSIGYRGVAGPFRVYQSHVWRHCAHGYTGLDCGREFDAVIPPWWDPADFPYVAQGTPYLVYVGRYTAPKGFLAAQQIAAAAKMPLYLIGHGDPEMQKQIIYGENLGALTTEERNRVVSNAQACLMPTQYLEPFGNVTAEAQLCGTPVLASDYGAFVESVEHGQTGYRCATLGEYVQAVKLSKSLDRAYIRERAIRLYSTDAAAAAYTRYFARFETVHTTGWRTMAPTLEEAPTPELAVA